MQTLLRRPRPRDPLGRIHNITPRNAEWEFTGFELFRLRPGETVQQRNQECEICAVLLSGTATFHVDGTVLARDVHRASPFDGGPWAIYAPLGADWGLIAASDCEIAICRAPARRRLPVRLIAPDDIARETRGTGANIRHVRDLLPQDRDLADSLLVVEALTPSGNWSSYPPHKHDTDDLPRESRLEEVYYHRFHPPQGFAFQRVYTDDRQIDETMAITDRDVVLVPRGYHPVSAPHGYDLYYLNVMAGPRRIWKTRADPDHAWLLDPPAAD